VEESDHDPFCCQHIANGWGELDATVDNEAQSHRPRNPTLFLTSLSLSSNSITDIGPLSDLTRLVSVDLGFNSITDISPLGQPLGRAHEPAVLGRRQQPDLRLQRAEWTHESRVVESLPYLPD
jgi:hypothetical protein